MKPGKIPAIAHVSHDSRIVGNYFFKSRVYKTGIFLNPKIDILHFDKTSFSPEITYHVHGYHTLRCGGIGKGMTKMVERVAFSVAEVMQVWKTECFHCFLVNKFAAYFPNLKE